MTSSTKARKTSTGGRDYGYANARIRGMRSRLLGEGFFKGLTAAPDTNTLIQDLSGTEYAPDLDEALIHGRTAASVDDALKNNLVRTYRKVQGFLNDEAAYIVTTLLGRWDVFNIKTILRGNHMHLSAHEIADGLLPAGALTQVDLDALTILGDNKAVVDTAVTWGLPFAPALREGYAEYMRSGELADLELALDRYYSQSAAVRLRGRRHNMAVAREILGVQIDTMNLVMVFRLQKADLENITVEDFFLAGGRFIRMELYNELAHMSDVDEVVERLKGTPYGHTLDATVLKYLEENSISVFERALEDYHMRKALAVGRGDPLGIGVAVAYLSAKQNEVTNLRIIVKGKSVGMPIERVRRELILV